MKKILLGLGCLSLALLIGLFTNAGIVRAVTTATPSTNEVNKTKNWAHANQLSMGPGETTLEFVSTRNFSSCFEYRTDGDTTQKTSETNYNTEVTDGLYPFICVKNQVKTQDIEADEYVEVRMVFGAEKDERFDWTRFNVEPKPEEPSEEEPVTTPSATVNHSSSSSSGPSMPTAPQCTASKPSMGVANINVIRTSDTTAKVQWSLHSGDNTHIMFGEHGTGWHHAALNVGTSGEAVITHLIPGRTYDWVVIPMNGCAAGSNSPVLSNI